MVACGYTEFLQRNVQLSETELAAELIDKYITCALPSNADSLRPIIEQIQTHHPSKSCLKRTSSRRFGFPKLPSELTLIAHPSVSETDKSLARSRQILLKAKTLLTDPNLPATFEDFYQQLNVSREDYQSALRVY